MVKDNFTPENLTIRELFNNHSYQIPNYQRQYAWMEEQLDELWHDLYDAYLNKDINSCYFLGSIVTVTNKDTNYLDLIDGQQRVTTLMIMMLTLYKDFNYLNEDNESERDNLIDSDSLNKCIFIRKKRIKLKLQSLAKFDDQFNEEVVERDSFKNVKKPTKSQLKKSEPRYKYINTAIFFYDKFSLLDKNDLEGFVDFIFNNTHIINIICNNEPFAIKLFQVLNDRGLDLSNADIIKSYLIEKVKKDDDQLLYDKFNDLWTKLENNSNRNEFKIDDFMVCYEYFKLKSNPKRQVSEELKNIIEINDIEIIISELTRFDNAMEKVFESKNHSVLGLRYIPWRFYTHTMLTSAFYVDYPDKEKLFELLRKYYYVSYIAGLTLNSIKQTSFNIIGAIVDKKPLIEIETIVNNFIIDRKLITKVDDALNDDVYNEKFIKPLLLTLEYNQSEQICNNFFVLDKRIHLDHVLPQGFTKNLKDWGHIDENEGKKFLNCLGNIALLQYDKNEGAQNCGFKEKIEFYSGSHGGGVTSFKYTRDLIDHYNNKKTWDIQAIKERRDYLIKEIKEMLNI